jgi:hypothetical protein
MPKLHLSSAWFAARPSGRRRRSIPHRNEIAPGTPRPPIVSLLQQGRIPEAVLNLFGRTSYNRRCPDTLPGKAASLSGDNTSAEKAWLKVVEIENESDLAAQAHFALAGLYRKQGKAEDAEREMAKFKQLQHTATPSELLQK